MALILPTGHRRPRFRGLVAIEGHHGDDPPLAEIEKADDGRPRSYAAEPKHATMRTERIEQPNIELEQMCAAAPNRHGDWATLPWPPFGPGTLLNSALARLAR